MKTLRVLSCLGLLVMAGCGGGGESSTLGSVFHPTKAIITVSIPPLPAGKQVAGVSFKIQLPAGVTPAVLSGNDASGSVRLTGGAGESLSAASYDASTNIITFGNISKVDFGSGDFLVVNCLIASDTTVTAGGFALLDGSVIDDSGAPVGVTPAISVLFQ